MQGAKGGCCACCAYAQSVCVGIAGLRPSYIVVVVVVDLLISAFLFCNWNIVGALDEGVVEMALPDGLHDQKAILYNQRFSIYANGER